jgi:hypothetical protein
MQQSTYKPMVIHLSNTLWTAPVRAFHWLAATSLAGAAILTSQGDVGHVTLGWIALGALLIQLIGLRKASVPNPALYLVTTGVLILNVSGLLAPHGTTHTGATLASLALAAFYCATVLFEFLQRLTARTVV